VIEMQLKGAPSWRLSVGDGHSVEQFMLFVRDAAMLQVPSDPVVPPQLLGTVARTIEFDPDEQRGVGAQWLSWWRDAVGLAVTRHHQNGQEGGRPNGRQRIADLQAVSDPPLFTALSERLALQRAARASIEEFRLWPSTTRRRVTTARPAEQLEWALMKQVAEDVAFDHAVSLDRVRATITVLPVEGLWWRQIAPGVVFCSSAAVADRGTAHALLREAFDSQVRSHETE
jgi:hypothetical protein